MTSVCKSLRTILLITFMVLVCLLPGLFADKNDGRGYWGDWGEVSECSVTCGSGTQQFERVYYPGPADPPLQDPDTPVIGTSVFSCTDANFPICPEDGRWTGWGRWSECTEGCGGGERKRKRSCYGQTKGGKECEGEDFDKEKCNKDPCPRLPPDFDMSLCQAEKNFTCTSKKMCIDMALYCNGVVQCHDGSDEKDCPVETYYGSIRYDLGNGFQSVHQLRKTIPVAASVVFALCCWTHLVPYGW